MELQILPLHYRKQHAGSAETLIRLDNWRSKCEAEGQTANGVLRRANQPLSP